MTMKKFIVEKGDEGQTSLKYIKRILKEAPNSFIYKMMRKKNIVLNGKKMEGNEKLSVGDEIKFFLSDDTFDNFSPAQSDISLEEYREAYARFGTPEIVYEDDNILMINKPVDMLSQKARSGDLTANEWLVGYLLNKGDVNASSLKSFMPSVCNRLDRNTGGILLFGKTVRGTNTLNLMLRDRTLDKYYLTAVHGKVKEKRTYEGYLWKNEETNAVKVTDSEIPGSSYIKTGYEPFEYLENNDISILKVKLYTGKSHQIRAHLAYLGFPVVGDFKYGNRKVSEEDRRNLGVFHQVLYCVEVKFPEISDYPEVSGKTFSINRPQIFERLK